MVVGKEGRAKSGRGEGLMVEKGEGLRVEEGKG